MMDFGIYFEDILPFMFNQQSVFLLRIKMVLLHVVGLIQPVAASLKQYFNADWRQHVDAGVIAINLSS